MYQEKVVMDVRAPVNRNVFFLPLERVLVGEIRQSEIRSDKTPGLLGQIGGTLPGDQFTVDFKAKKYKITHKLHLPEFKEMANRVRALAGSEQGGFQRFGAFGQDEEGTFSDDDVPTWLFHLRRLVDEKKLHITNGVSLPAMNEIRRLGPIRVGQDGGLVLKQGNNYGMKTMGVMEPVEDEQPVAAGAGARK